MRASDLAKPTDDRVPAQLPRRDEPAPRGARKVAPLGVRDETTPTGRRTPPRLRVVESTDDEAVERDPEQLRRDASLALVKKLRSRGMSISEAHAYLRGLGYDDEIQGSVVDDCVARGYLDDAVLAEQLVYAGSKRKGQGRRAIALALAGRGIERSIIDAALAELPDDDAERALEFARSKANSMARLDSDVALRRLMGQLARRGFSGSIARDAANSALREVSGPRFR